MSNDPNTMRRELAMQINDNPRTKEELEAQEGRVWTTEEMRQQFNVIGFAAPLLVVVRKADQVKGSLFFQHSPRLFWGWHQHSATICEPSSAD